MISAAQKSELDKAILAHQAAPSGSTRLKLGQIIDELTSPDIAPKILRENSISHSLVYEWEIGGYTFRGHVHYEELENRKEEIRNEEGPIPGNAWIENVDDFSFPLPDYVMDVEKGDLKKQNGKEIEENRSERRWRWKRQKKTNIGAKMRDEIFRGEGRGRLGLLYIFSK